jgi:hypothetical protein
MGQIRGRDTILECRITAFPQATNHWEKSGRRIMSSARHSIEAYDDGDNWLTLSLRINDIDAKDYGEYQCVAANALGNDRQSIQLFGNYRFFCAMDGKRGRSHRDWAMTSSPQTHWIQ